MVRLFVFIADVLTHFWTKPSYKPKHTPTFLISTGIATILSADMKVAKFTYPLHRA
ncbi:hypothetical protein QNS29_002005 [Vibrio parahaemolyticus]|nr:hypothetical protein [Vibrio parahaemolyticus]